MAPLMAGFNIPKGNNAKRNFVLPRKEANRLTKGAFPTWKLAFKDFEFWNSFLEGSEISSSGKMGNEFKEE